MLGRLSRTRPVTAAKTLKQHYADYPCLKNIISFDAGTQTAYSHLDAANLQAMMQPYDWTATKQGEASAVVANDAAEHNKDLVAGSWGQPSLNDSMWIVCGTLTSGTDEGASEGASIFGFGDSLPNNAEIVIAISGNRPYALFKGTNSAGGATGNTTQVPANVGELGAFTSQTATSLICVIHRPNGGELGDAALELVLVTPDATTTITVSENPLGSGFANFPARYSLGQSLVDTGAFPAFEGSWKGLSVIASLNFEAGIPPTYLADLEEARVNWASGRKVLPTAWKGLL